MPDWLFQIILGLFVFVAVLDMVAARKLHQWEQDEQKEWQKGGMRW